MRILMLAAIVLLCVGVPLRTAAQVQRGPWPAGHPSSRVVQIPPVPTHPRQNVAKPSQPLKATDRSPNRLEDDSSQQDESDNDYDSKAFTSAVKKLVWNKDGFKIVPYGAVHGDIRYETSRTNDGSFTVYVFPGDDQGEDAFILDIRRSRLGLNVTAPQPLPYIESLARVEIDFQGEFVTQNRASLLLRHCYWEWKSDSFRLLFGQTDDVISPYYPGVIDYGGGLDGGNIGYRRAQLRVEQYLEFSRRFLLTLQGSANQDIVPDFPVEPSIRSEPAAWPTLMGRAAITLGPRTDDEAQATTLGVSGHIGETGFDFLTAGPPPLNLPPEDDARFRTWSINADLHVPLSSKFGVTGEFFMGENLSPFFGGIGQGVCPCLRVPIASIGGWVNLQYRWTDRHETNIGYGVDDPDNSDTLFGRVYNQFFFANLLVDVTDDLSTGVEVAFWKTLYLERRVGLIPPDQLLPSQRGEAVVIDWTIKYAF